MRTGWTGAGLAAVLLSAAVTAQAADTKEVHRTLSLDRDGRLSIDTYKGTVTVTTWEKPEVRVDALIEPDGDDRESREKVQWTEVRISGGGASIEIKSDYDEGSITNAGFFRFSMSRPVRSRSCATRSRCRPPRGSRSTTTNQESTSPT